MAREKKYLIFLSTIFLFFLSANFCLAAFEVNLVPYGLPANPTLPDYIKFFFEEGAAIGGALAVLAIVAGAAVYMFSSVSPEKAGTGKSMMTSGILGLVLLLSSYIIINSINPQIKNMQTQTFRQLTGLFLSGGSVPDAPAPLMISNAQEIKGTHPNIYWPDTYDDGQGHLLPNCDIQENLPYIVYPGWNGSYDFNLRDTISCGHRYTFGTETADYIVKEVPGVYFYNQVNCRLSNTQALPDPHTGSIGNMTSDIPHIKSFRIVNGGDITYGPFYGVIFYSLSNYRGGFLHFPAKLSPGDYLDNCYNLKDDQMQQVTVGGTTDKFLNAGSIAIYEHFGISAYAQDKEGQQGVAIFTKPNYSGGFYSFTDENITNTANSNSNFNTALSTFKPDYSKSNLAPEEQALCNKFNSKKCLQSIGIYGHYLVLISTSEDLEERGGFTIARWSQTTLGEQFPSTITSEKVTSEWNQYNAKDGPIDLNLDWFYDTAGGQPGYLEIIPLSKDLF